MTAALSEKPRCENCGLSLEFCEGGCWDWDFDLEELERIRRLTDLTEDVQYARYSEWSRYPLPPFPAQINVEMDGYNRYKLPSPTTGRLTAYTRATTVSSTIADYYALNRWKQRMVAVNIMKLLDQSLLGTDSDFNSQFLLTKLRAAIKNDPSEKTLGRLLDEIDNELGGADAKELGGAVHDWIAELDMGRVLLHQIPEQFQPYALAYQDCMARAGLIAIPEYTERLVLNDIGAESIAGRLDGICLCVETGELHVLDRKTSKTLDFSWLEYGAQFAVYAFASKMLLPDRSGWEPMPDLNLKQAFCVHVPSDQPERSQVVPFALAPGAEAMTEALTVRDLRRNAEKRIAGGTYPIPSAKTLRYVEARQALQNIHNEDEARALVVEYENVWDNDLNEFGAQCFDLLMDPNNNDRKEY